MRVRGVAAGLGLLLVMVICAVYMVWTALLFPPTRPISVDAFPGRPGESVPSLERIEPGALVGPTLPVGWSHRIITTRLRLQSGDLDSLPEAARATATKFRTTILADVRPNLTGKFELRRVGIGLMVHRGDLDVVVDPDSFKRLDESAAFLDELVLARADQALNRGRIAARTSTFALYDASVEAVEGSVHRSIYLRYAILVDPETGGLNVAYWPIAHLPNDRTPPEFLTVLPPALSFDCGLHVEAVRVFGGLPVSWYFAMVTPPSGQACSMIPELREIAAEDSPTPEKSAAIEAAARRSIDSCQTPSIDPSR